MHYADIQAAITKAGHTHQTVLAKIRVPVKSTTMVSHVIHGRKRSRPIESVITEVTGIPPQTLWPQWYPAQSTQRAA